MGTPTGAEGPQDPTTLGVVASHASRLASSEGASERAAVRVAAVVPCHNRQDDLDLILGDLREAVLVRDDVRVELRIVVVDNCSAVPLHSAANPAAEIHRLPSNRGGSGGFNAGMQRALADSQVDFVWLVDSDARLEPRTMINLVWRLLRRPDLVALGCALADPVTKVVHEIGGVVNRRTGCLGPARVEQNIDHDDHELVACDYAASCCLLVRAEGIRVTGLMPEVFLNGDDSEWCIRLSEKTGLNVAADPSVVAYHPRFDRFPTWARYYHSRNGFGAIAALGLGRLVRWRRARIEAARAINQALMGRKDLARLHIRGLADAAFKDPVGQATERASKFDRFRPMEQLGDALGPAEVGVRDGLFVHPALELTPMQRQSLAGALGISASEVNVHGAGEPDVLSAWRGFLGRMLMGSRFGVAVVPASGGPSAWIAAPTQIQLVPDGFVVRRVSRWSAMRAAARTLARSLWYSMIIAAQHGKPGKLPAATSPSASPLANTAASSATGSPRSASIARVRPSGTPLSIIVLSYNRRTALGETLRALEGDSFTRSAEVIVVDNASTDGSVEMVREGFPRVKLITLGKNLGVSAFNRGVESAGGEYVLVLDDDAAPESESLDIAMRLLMSRPDLAAVSLLPRHPDTGVAEWPSAANMPRERDRWPMMGCGNLVRRIDWLKVGGYESRFFLYRNDTDLALKLLGSGKGVHFNPAWVVWHDSPAAAKKSLRWLHLATRNWLWMARRHARTPWRTAWGVAFGALWAFRLAGWERQRLAAVWRGTVEGLTQPKGRLPRIVRPTGSDFATLLRLQLMSRAASRPSPAVDAAEPSGVVAAVPVTSSSSTPRHSA